MSNRQLVDGVLAKLQAWAKATQSDTGTDGIYVFGSLIRRKGEQFNRNSDVDLLVVIPDKIKTSEERVAWLEELGRRKRVLELDLMTLLTRENANEAISSVVAATSLELQANVHKDGTTDFFSTNTFRSLLDNTEHNGIPYSGSRHSDRLVTGCLKFAQKQRNAFLNVGPNGTQHLRSFDGNEPLPKEIMRHAAMAKELHRPSGISGAETDTQLGLDFIGHLLYNLAESSDSHHELQNIFSVRRGARGIRTPISPLQQLMLSEIVFDVASQDESIPKAARQKFISTTRDALPSINGMDSTVFFSDRFAKAFPGVRSAEIYEDPSQIKTRLNRLLMKPLVFAETTPIWWWRNGNLQIYRFEDLGNTIFLMNDEELRIRKIAAVHGGEYFRSFVYIEVDAMEPTGLYSITPQRIAANISKPSGFGYYWEEYGIVDGVHKVTAYEQEDGAAVINGELQDISGRTERRTRYVTPYNFVIAAHGSPINNPDFDSTLEKTLQGILSETVTLDQLVEEVKKLPKRH